MTAPETKNYLAHNGNNVIVDKLCVRERNLYQEWDLN